jgi:hypothetical protein
MPQTGSQKKQPHTRGDLAPRALCFFLHWQETLKTLPDNIAFGNPVAVWLELRQKSGCSELLNCPPQSVHI